MGEIRIEKNKKKSLVPLFYVSLSLFLLFVVYTVCVKFIDVKQIGPSGSSVGFSTMNEFFKDLFGFHESLYLIVDYSSILPALVATFFACCGLFQWIKRKDISKVDNNIIILGLLYAFCAIVYVFFEIVKINFRPVILNGVLETSYPSSTTVLSICFMISLLPQIDIYIKSKPWRITLKCCAIAFSAFLVVGRILAGVHWASDIIGGMIISSALLTLYWELVKVVEVQKNRS